MEEIGECKHQLISVILMRSWWKKYDMKKESILKDMNLYADLSEVQSNCDCVASQAEGIWSLEHHQ